MQEEWAWHQPIALLLGVALFLDSKGRWIAKPYGRVACFIEARRPWAC